jgi:AcrR family transcriptional regulator
MATTRRERLQEATRDEIKGVARQHMAREGSAAISLRAIARDMGLSAPALYRYYPSRDDLITALVVDAFVSLGDALERARVAHLAAPVFEQAVAVCMAYRDWALANALDYDLIFGNPIPGYHAPGELTIPAVRRAFQPFIQVILRAWQQGAFDVAHRVHASPALTQRLLAWQHNAGVQLPPAVHQASIGLWCCIHGMITLELFNHLQPIMGDPSDFYVAEMHSFLLHLGLQPTRPPAQTSPP